jgi:hypothetical protein
LLSVGLLALWVVSLTAGCGPEAQTTTPIETTAPSKAPGGNESIDEYKAKMQGNVKAQGGSGGR